MRGISLFPQPAVRFGSNHRNIDTIRDAFAKLIKDKTNLPESTQVVALNKELTSGHFLMIYDGQHHTDAADDKIIQALRQLAEQGDLKQFGQRHFRYQKTRIIVPAAQTLMV